MSPKFDISGRAVAPRPPPPDSLAELCANHAHVPTNGHFPSGTVFGDWRLTAFIGRGGNGEVYCAEHTTLGTSAAVKVLMREDERAKIRFTREARLLSDLKSEAFPRFLAYGEANGFPYLAMELLEPGELPTGDHSIARFLLKVYDAVAELHAHGYVHRDIKPGNILWRTVGSRVPRDRRRAGRASLPIPVLADLGLVKEIKTTDFGLRTPSLTVVDGRRAGVGTPGYGAPEQMERGEATVTSDIHALGVLADRCFDGNPPRVWSRIIQRATSSIPVHRYQSVSADNNNKWDREYNSGKGYQFVGNCIPDTDYHVVFSTTNLVVNGTAYNSGITAANFIEGGYGIALYRNLKNAALAVTCDAGNPLDIHPNTKGIVAKRLALHALKRDYGFDDVIADSPTLKNWKVDGGSFVLSFDNATAWYCYNADRSEAKGFEIAGPDGKFVPAEIVNKNTKGTYSGSELIVRADGVTEPRAIRYLYSSPWTGSLYSFDSGLPLGSFEVKTALKGM